MQQEKKKANLHRPFFLLLLLLPSIISDSGIDATHQTFIVFVDPSAKPSLFPTHSHWYHSLLLSSSLDQPSSAACHPLHIYSSSFHGFAARLAPSLAVSLSVNPSVISVIPELIRQPSTTHSPTFLGLNPVKPNGRNGYNNILSESDFGSELVVGVIDTGITPTHPSFSGKDLNPVPSSWRGVCVAGPGFSSDHCNSKLVGARFFSAGYEASAGAMNETAEMKSPIDTDGHGTHTASIAVGRYVYPAEALGYARGVAAGMAPKAKLAVYKVCWIGGCFDSDILAAFDAAIADGVDVISLSVGGVVVPYHLDAIAIGAYAAAEKGIFVSASAGNGGPGELTVTNVAPWVTTVGAGSIDRTFPANIVLGNGKTLAGVSVYAGAGIETDKFYSLVYSGGDSYSSSLCLEGSLTPSTVAGKIVVCDRGVNSRTAKGQVVKQAGGIGMILANVAFDGEGTVADCHVLPAISVGAKAGDIIRRYISSHSNTAARGATAKLEFAGTRLGVKPAPVVASFSARGPSPQSPEILKPDIIAPGLNILSAWPETVGPAGIAGDTRRSKFNILSGTSMACPHVSGVAALLKAANPEWSAAAIRSALMTTAYDIDNRGGMITDEATGNSSDVFAIGSGHVDPQRALNPGLIYDITLGDYVDFLCNLNYTIPNIKSVTRRSADCRGAKRAGHTGNLNYPSMSAVFTLKKTKMSTHFIRTATNVGPAAAAVYNSKVKPPEGFAVTVKPERLVFRRVGQKLSFVVRVEEMELSKTPPEKLSPGREKVSAGELVWTDGTHKVRSPIVISVQAPLS